MRTTQRPTVTKGAGHWKDETITSHPAFGVVTLSRPQGHASPMFGSDLEHSSCMRLTVYAADMHRSLNNDRTNERDKIVQFEFTLSQFAQFVASQGIGQGTPCTINYRRMGPLEAMPGIAPAEVSHAEKFGGEMRESVARQIGKVRDALTRIGDVLENGRGSKKAMRDALSAAQAHLNNLPANVEFVNTQFAESMETITQQAKTEVEGFVVGMAMRTGIESLRERAPTLNSGTSRPEAIE